MVFITYRVIYSYVYNISKKFINMLNLIYASLLMLLKN